jgi:hypothetical protein
MIACTGNEALWGEKDSNLRSSRNGFTVRPIWPLWNLPRIILVKYIKILPITITKKLEPLAGIEPATY